MYKIVVKRLCILTYQFHSTFSKPTPSCTFIDISVAKTIFIVGNRNLRGGIVYFIPLPALISTSLNASSPTSIPKVCCKTMFLIFTLPK